MRLLGPDIQLIDGPKNTVIFVKIKEDFQDQRFSKSTVQEDKHIFQMRLFCFLLAQLTYYWYICRNGRIYFTTKHPTYRRTLLKAQVPAEGYAYNKSMLRRYVYGVSRTGTGTDVACEWVMFSYNEHTYSEIFLYIACSRNRKLYILHNSHPQDT